MGQEKRAVLVISFGTSYKETREKTIDAIEKEIGSAFSGYEFRRAYTSPTIIRILKNRDQISIDNVEQALLRLAEDGFTHVVAQPTLVIKGFEYDRMMAVLNRYRDRFESLVCGAALLASDEDYVQAVEILGKELSDRRREKHNIILMGHGTEHAANDSYRKLQKELVNQGFSDYLVGTVESSPTLDHMLSEVKAQAVTSVVLTPFMVVAGDHACQDMAGEEADSWKNRFLSSGYETECLMKGLGEYEGIRRMFVEHAKAAESRLHAGTLYGIGVGPGDPELLTLKAVRLIRTCDVIAVPGEDYRNSVAFQIAVRAVPELQKKECIGVVLPMTRDRTVLAEHHDKGAGQVEALLDAGKTVGFLNLGDVTVYASYLYIHRLVTEHGYRTELVNGIPSFCAAAARLGIGLAENSDQLHILSQPEQIEEGLKLPGTKVIMKMGKNIGRTKEEIREAKMEARMVENCGMEGEKLCHSVDEIDEQAGYYSLLIVKELRDE